MAFFFLSSSALSFFRVSVAALKDLWVEPKLEGVRSGGRKGRGDEEEGRKGNGV